MKNQVKLTKRFSKMVVVVTVFAVTFFVTSAVVLAQTVDWSGPTARPPQGNPPGFIFNSSDQRQNAQINITGPAKIETQVIVADGTANEVVIGSGAIRTPQICLPPYDAASCVSSWSGVTGGGSFWLEDSRGWIYNDSGDNPNNLGFRVYDSGKAQFHYLNDWLEIYPAFSEGTVAQGGTGTGDNDKLVIKWGDDTNDELAFINNLNYLSSGNDQTVLTLKRDQVLANQRLYAANGIQFPRSATADGIHLISSVNSGRDLLVQAEQNLFLLSNEQTTGAEPTVGDVIISRDSETFALSNPYLVVKSGSTGNVGIGTINPSTKLSVKAPAGQRGYVSVDADANREAGIILNSAGAGKWWLYRNEGTSGATAGDFGIWSPLRPTVDDFHIKETNGNVGIGLMNPTEKLQVAGNIKASGTICDGTGNCVGAGGGVFVQAGTNSASYYGRMNVTGTNSIGIKLSDDKALTTLADSNTLAITNGELALNRLSARGTIDAHTDLCLTSSGISQCGLTAIQLQTAGMPAPLSATRPFRSSGVPQMLVDEGPDKLSRIEFLGENASGIIANVGPNSRFSVLDNKFGFVVANPTYPGGQGLWINTADNNKFGFVGIGTTDPQARLDVSGTTFFRSNPTTGGGHVEIEAYYNDAEEATIPDPPGSAAAIAALNNPSRGNYGGVFAGGLRVNEYYDGDTNTMRKTRRGPSGTFEMKEWGDWMFTVVPDLAADADANPTRKTPLTIKNDGRVGIMTSDNSWNDGTQMEDAALTVRKVGGGATVDLYGTGNPSYDYSGIRLWDDGMSWGGNNQHWGIWQGSGVARSYERNDFKINYYDGANYTERLVIDSVTANVGIGVNDPAADLTVSGQILAMGTDYARVTLGHGPENPSTSQVWVMDNYYFPSNGTHDKLFRIYPQNTLTTNQTNWQNFFLMAPNGNLGLGVVPTTSSGNKLHVAGNIKATGTICDGSNNCIGAGSNTWTTSGTNINSANTGNVGIGTASPTVKLDVVGSGISLKPDATWSSGDVANLRMPDDWHSIKSYYSTADEYRAYNGFKFITSATNPAMTIATDGSVGIGTVTHSAVRLRTAISGQGTAATEAIVGTNNTQDSVVGIGDSVWGSIAQNVGGTSGYGVGVFGFSATPNGIGVQGSVTNSTGYSGYFTGGRGMYVDKLCFANGECKTSWSGGIVSACTPNCSGRECGDNGCGGSCGSCAADESCNPFGACEGTDPKSDARLKDIAGKYQYGLDEVLALNPVIFSFKSGNPYNLSTKPQVGLIAQDVEPVIPEAISRDDKGYLGINQNSIIYAMLNAIKQQQEQIVKLQVQVAELQNSK